MKRFERAGGDLFSMWALLKHGSEASRANRKGQDGASRWASRWLEPKRWHGAGGAVQCNAVMAQYSFDSIMANAQKALVAGLAEGLCANAHPVWALAIE